MQKHPSSNQSSVHSRLPLQTPLPCSPSGPVLHLQVVGHTTPSEQVPTSLSRHPWSQTNSLSLAQSPPAHYARLYPPAITRRKRRRMTHLTHSLPGPSHRLFILLPSPTLILNGPIHLIPTLPTLPRIFGRLIRVSVQNLTVRNVVNPRMMPPK